MSKWIILCRRLALPLPLLRSTNYHIYSTTPGLTSRSTESFSGPFLLRSISKYFWRKLAGLLIRVWPQTRPRAWVIRGWEILKCKLKWRYNWYYQPDCQTSSQSSPSSPTKWQRELLSCLRNFLISLADSCGGGCVCYTLGDNQWRNTTYFIRNRPPASHFSIIYLGYLSIVCQNAKFPWDKTRHLLHPILQIRLPAILSYVLWFPGWGVFLEILRRDIVVHIIQQCVGAHYQCHRSLPWVQTLRTLNASPAAACNHLMILVLTSGSTSCQC